MSLHRVLPVGALLILTFASFLAIPSHAREESDEIKELVEHHIASNKIAMFSKSYCPFCARAKRMAVDELGVKPGVIELDLRPKGDGPPIQRQVGKMIKSDRLLPTVPQIWVNGEYIGGSDDLRKAIDSGKVTKETVAAGPTSQEEL
uniref:Glutaredoxin domain-containing protein n=1 Tax=Pyramimonas obovata TaxID=1411642 RepID=A0A7S0N1Y1_9CHLO|mmetsp:Transcript_18250/g.39896  ORF Transcript_18250/g.39896 Transcript_18250/m.39896 type:complete len:147 (+) Transcript_18250:215-655(+)|eukprot:CAMPEP_0118927294 /NCGR_PEP_ID=MMETSP1169-20130426/4791_1 /TAXON_ID=36882 /ORGANISM="Pyramimonas obovata, Strain CCMP722" /LENGTH=146 /DNA_ID=CAMNT_0006869033 /DNA_START=207 /DNA_END=647 /DNA_ORIENTATION=-